MFNTESEARIHISELCRKELLDIDHEPYVPLYHTKKQGWFIYPKVATLEVKAMRTNSYAGKDACVLVDDEHGNLLFGQTTVYRYIMDIKQAFSSDPIYFSEYANANVKWHQDKKRMFTSKVALSRALRHAFPDIFGVIITYEEAKCKLEFDDYQAPPAKATPTKSSTKAAIEKLTIPLDDSDITKLVSQSFGVK